MSDNNSDFGAFLAGFVIGGLVGAATALLLAPQSGEEMRTVIKDKSIELKEKANLSTAEARARAEAALKEAQARYDELTLQAKSKTEELLQRGQVLVDEQKAKVEEVIASVKKPEAGKEAKASTEAE
jgi:gas vesicle protein